MLKYDTLEQAQMRLNGMIITQNDRPWYISGVTGRDGDINLRLTSLPMADYLVRGEKLDDYKFDTKTVSQDDPSLNFRLFEVGYINDGHGKAAVWPQRTTARQQHQGLSGALLNVNNRVMFGTGFVDMIAGRYPDRETAMKMLADDWFSVAISPDFAVGRSRDHGAIRILLYRGREVGVAVGAKAKMFVLNEEDAYLGDLLEEQGLPFEIDAVESLD